MALVNFHDNYRKNVWSVFGISQHCHTRHLGGNLLNLVQLQEFMIATDMTSRGDPEEKLRWAFRMYDKVRGGPKLLFDCHFESFNGRQIER